MSSGPPEQVHGRRPELLPALRNMAGAYQDRPTEGVERLRLESTESLEASHRAVLGQFFTPSPVARLIASMLTVDGGPQIRLLDPGAGVGSLTAAAVEHFADIGVRELEVVVWEIDAKLHSPLCATLEQCAAWAMGQGLSVSWELQGGDYIEATSTAVADELEPDLGRFDAIIMNPPYRKVNGGSLERLALERIGLPITNLYTAFLALAATQLAHGGVLAAITPRSFANGLYSAPFRRFFFDRVGIEQLHLFDSRAHVFADADVLQENVVFSARRDIKPQIVRLSFSHGIEDASRVREVPAEEILRPDDPQLFLRIPGEEEDTEVAKAMAALPSSLKDLGIAVSTGKVVEFRAREHLRITPEPGTAPLIRPNHFKDNGIRWPAIHKRKPNALVIDSVSEKLLLPNETYVLVKRLTAKEERRRVRAVISDPSVTPSRQIAFENHLNVFHCDHQGLPDDLARGLAAFLNSSFVDCYVRQFNGHTQINATDLRHLRYPNAEDLCRLGETVLHDRPATQEELDEIVDEFLPNSAAVELREVA